MNGWAILGIILLALAVGELVVILLAIFWPPFDSGPRWSQPDPGEQRPLAGQPILTYCPWCWAAFRERHLDWDPPDVPDGIPVSCAEHRLHGPRNVRPCEERQVRS